MELNEKKNGLSDLLQTSTEKLREMVNANTVVGEPITTPDGVTLIPVSRMSFGFGCGGGDYGKTGVTFGGGEPLLQADFLMAERFVAAKQQIERLVIHCRPPFQLVESSTIVAYRFRTCNRSGQSSKSRYKSARRVQRKKDRRMVFIRLSFLFIF